MTMKATRARAALATAERSNLQGNAKLALASAEMAMRGIPQERPYYLRAQDIAMVSKEQIKKDKKTVSENRGALLTAAIGGGVIGAALMAALLVFAGRIAVGDTIVRGALDAASRNPRRDRRPAARPAICPDPRRQPARARNPLRLVVERRRQARRHPGRILRLCLRLLPRQPAAHRSPAGRGQGPARRLPRTADPRPRQHRRRARSRWPRRRPAASARSMTRSTPPGAPGRDTFAIAAKAAGISADPGRDPRI